MKRLVVLIVVVGLATAAAATFGSAAPVGQRPHGCASREAEAPCLAGCGEVPRQVADRGQVRHAAVRLAGHERAQPRL